MKVAIMQPYFFPYIGYFQLIKAVDVFVVYDDVNFIKQGWISRNKILLDKKEFNLVLQIEGASSFKKINEIQIGNNRKKIIKNIDQAYKKAPYFDIVFPILNEIILRDENNLSKVLIFALQKISQYLELVTVFKVSSHIEKNNNLKGQEKVLEICKKMGATDYINAIGGKELYDYDMFSDCGIRLNFIKTNSIVYKQFENDFVPWLSIIDILMFNSVEEIRTMLNNYELV